MMYRKSIEKRILTKRSKAKKSLRLYDQGTPRLTMLQGRFIRNIENYFRKQIKDRIEYIDTIPELSRATEKMVINKIAIKKVSDADAKRMLAFSEVVITGAMTEGVKEFVDKAPTNRQFKAGFGLKSDKIKEYAKTRAGELITGLDETTKKRVMFTISEAIANGDSVVDIKAKLMKHFAFSKYRASLIASTELGGAYLEGKKQSYLQTMEYYGIPPSNGRKQVQVHDDDRICPICQACTPDVGKWVRYDEPFSNGLMFAVFHIGCRCNTSFSMFNPDDPTLDRKQNRPKQIVEPTVEDTVEPEIKKLSDANKYVEDYFVATPDFKGLGFEDAKVSALAIKEMYKKMPFLDRLPKLRIRNSKNTNAWVTHSLSTNKTVEFGVSRSIGGNRFGEFAKQTAETIAKLEKRIEDYRNNPNEALRDAGIKSTELFMSKVKKRSDIWTIRELYNGTDGQKYTIYHEFGHVLDNFIKYNGGKARIAGDVDSTISKILGKRSVIEYFHKSLKEKNILSEYGATNVAETYAEAWTAYYTERYDRITPAVKDYFDEILALLNKLYGN